MCVRVGEDGGGEAVVRVRDNEGENAAEGDTEAGRGGRLGDTYSASTPAVAGRGKDASAFPTGRERQRETENAFFLRLLGPALSSLEGCLPLRILTSARACNTHAHTGSPTSVW